MNDHVILANQTSIAIEDGGSLGSLVSIVNSEEAAVLICNALVVPQNLSHVEFIADPDEAVYAEYDNLVILSTPTRESEIVDDEPTGRVIIRFGFRESTDIELRILELEETQLIQDGAIEELAEIIAEG